MNAVLIAEATARRDLWADLGETETSDAWEAYRAQLAKLAGSS